MYIHMCVRACINEYVRSATEEEEEDEDEDEDEVGKEDEEIRKSEEEEEEVSFKSAIHLVHRRRESRVIRERERENALLV